MAPSPQPPTPAPPPQEAAFEMFTEDEGDFAFVEDEGDFEIFEEQPTEKRPPPH
jgi:hypothetical protein